MGLIDLVKGNVHHKHNLGLKLSSCIQFFKKLIYKMSCQASDCLDGFTLALLFLILTMALSYPKHSFQLSL